MNLNVSNISTVLHSTPLFFRIQRFHVFCSQLKIKNVQVLLKMFTRTRRGCKRCVSLDDPSQGDLRTAFVVLFPYPDAIGVQKNRPRPQRGICLHNNVSQSFVVRHRRVRSVADGIGQLIQGRCRTVVGQTLQLLR
jgi:hypothetical protein